MTTLPKHMHDLAYFERYIKLPENANKTYELIAGDIVEVPSNPYVSKIAILIATYINLYLFNHDIGHVTGEAGGYIVAGDRYAPDVAYIAYEKQAELAQTGYNPNPPDIAVEVVSSDSGAEQAQLMIKLSNYLAVGTMVWIVRPQTRSIEVHQANTPVRVYRYDETLTLKTILPDFQLKLADVFKDLPSEQ